MWKPLKYETSDPAIKYMPKISVEVLEQGVKYVQNQK